MSEENTQSEIQNELKVTAANASRFEQANLSEPLTAFATGWKDPENLGSLLEFIAPKVIVPRRFEYRSMENKEVFLSDEDDIRAIGSDFKRVEYTGHLHDAHTQNKGLTIRIDHDEIFGDDWQERYVDLLMQRLLRNELRRALFTLGHGITGETKKWDGTAIPDADLRKLLTEATNDSGVRPNRLLIGEAAWDSRISAYESGNNPAHSRAAELSPESLASKLLLSDVKVMSARYQTGKGKEQLLGKEVFAFYAQPGATKDEPSNLKRFVSGDPFNVYVEDHAKYTDITVEHYSNIVRTSDLGIRKLTIN